MKLSILFFAYLFLTMTSIAKPTCTSTISCTNSSATCDATGWSAGSSLVIGSCGTSSNQKSLFCGHSFYDVNGVFLEQQLDYICCDKNGDAQTIPYGAPSGIVNKICGN